MFELAPKHISALKNWFVPDRIGSLVGSHVIQTRNGRCVVNHWPFPQVVLVEIAGNYMLLGEPSAVAPADLVLHIRGFVETSEAFVPLLRRAFPDLQV